MKFECIMISRVPVEVKLPPKTYYNHNSLDSAIREQYSDSELAEMFLANWHMEHYTRLRE